MSRPTFVNPDFVENNEAEEIQDRMMNNLPSDISDMEGDFPYDFTMPTAIEISKLTQFNLVQALMVAFPEYAWGDWLDLHGAQAGVTRRQAIAAVGTVTVTADYGTVLAAGTVFAVPATDTSEAVYFESTEEISFDLSTVQEIPVQAVTAGAAGNVPAGTITIMEMPINGVTAIINEEATEGGVDEEDDDTYYERIHAENADANFYVGNDSDYIKWAKEVDGVGNCIVEPAWNGPGTVRLIIVDSSGEPAGNELLQAVYDHIVSPDDRSARMLPTGTAELTVAGATLVTINYACTGMVLDGISAEEASAAFANLLSTVYAAAKEEGVLRYNDVRPLLASIDGVEDFSDFLMNNGHANIAISSSEYAKTGTITFAELNGGES